MKNIFFFTLLLMVLVISQGCTPRGGNCSPTNLNCCDEASCVMTNGVGTC